MNVTALTVSRRPVDRPIFGIERKCLHGRHFTRASHVRDAWLDALELVETDRFFFIDDTDELPFDILDVLEQCIATGAALAYTDELVGAQRRERAAYSQAAHIANPTLVHHLALCDTQLAREVARDLPVGDYWPEMMLFWEMAKRGGAAHVPRVGYIWRKEATGLHREPFTVRGMAASRAWCIANP